MFRDGQRRHSLPVGLSWVCTVEAPLTPRAPLDVAIKRGIDLAFALSAALMLSPLLLLLAVATLFADGRPIFHRQMRVGRHDVPFRLSKIRTMREAFGQDGEPLPDDRRVTSLGRYLRRYRLDELPGFFLIVRGSMSMVGPRPLPLHVLATMAGSSMRRAVRPGITGLAQISGNTLLSNREKLAIDLHYVRHWSNLSDLIIITKTIETLVRGELRDEVLIRRALNEYTVVEQNAISEAG